MRPPPGPRLSGAEVRSRLAENGPCQRVRSQLSSSNLSLGFQIFVNLPVAHETAFEFCSSESSRYENFPATSLRDQAGWGTAAVGHAAVLRRGIAYWSRSAAMAAMSATRQAVIRGPSFTGRGYRPERTPAHHVLLETRGWGRAARESPPDGRSRFSGEVATVGTGRFRRLCRLRPWILRVRVNDAEVSRVITLVYSA